MDYTIKLIGEDGYKDSVQCATDTDVENAVVQMIRAAWKKPGRQVLSIVVRRDA